MKIKNKIKYICVFVLSFIAIVVLLSMPSFFKGQKIGVDMMVTAGRFADIEIYKYPIAGQNKLCVEGRSLVNKRILFKLYLTESGQVDRICYGQDGHMIVKYTDGGLDNITLRAGDRIVSQVDYLNQRCLIGSDVYNW